ncbi:MAG TPA: SRPBCC family protein, partial [Marmoricola sp.]|nr:SRPBCC family protein [Marmoricola sp.]
MPAFSLSRETTIQASPDQVHALINDFRNWAQWSPWEARDPELKRTFSGAESGLGAKYAWEGNKQVGSGTME